MKKPITVILLILLVSMTVGITVIYERALTNAHFQKSKVRVGALAQGLLHYAGNNNDSFPAEDMWPIVLVEQGSIDLEWLDAPYRDQQETEYFYVPGARPWNSEDIVVYQNPLHWKQGVLVGFADGHREVIQHDDFERMLAAQQSETDH